MIAIIDYGVGNLYSLRRSLDYLGLESRVTRNSRDVRAASRLILPGVGAFGDAMDRLIATGLVPVLLERAAAGVPFLGICLGMQLLFERSYEYGEHPGLGLIPGSVCPLRGDVPPVLKVPQIGWNALSIRRAHPLLASTRTGDCVYYVHSYYAKHCEDALVATSEYGVDVPGVVANKNVLGTQFHPEKSGKVGLLMLKAFAEIKEAELC